MIVSSQNKNDNPHHHQHSAHKALVESRYYHQHRPKSTNRKTSPTKQQISNLEYNILMNNPQFQNQTLTSKLFHCGPDDDQCLFKITDSKRPSRINFRALCPNIYIQKLRIIYLLLITQSYHPLYSSKLSTPKDSQHSPQKNSHHRIYSSSKTESMEMQHNESSQFKTALNILRVMIYEDKKIDGVRRKYLAEFFQFLQYDHQNYKAKNFGQNKSEFQQQRQNIVVNIMNKYPIMDQIFIDILIYEIERKAQEVGGLNIDDNYNIKFFLSQSLGLNSKFTSNWQFYIENINVIIGIDMFTLDYNIYNYFSQIIQTLDQNGLLNGLDVSKVGGFDDQVFNRLDMSYILDLKDVLSSCSESHNDQFFQGGSTSLNSSKRDTGRGSNIQPISGNIVTNKYNITHSTYNELNGHNQISNSTRLQKKTENPQSSRNSPLVHSSLQTQAKYYQPQIFSKIHQVNSIQFQQFPQQNTRQPQKKLVYIPRNIQYKDNQNIVTRPSTNYVKAQNRTLTNNFIQKDNKIAIQRDKKTNVNDFNNQNDRYRIYSLIEQNKISQKEKNLTKFSQINRSLSDQRQRQNERYEQKRRQEQKKKLQHQRLQRQAQEKQKAKARQLQIEKQRQRQKIIQRQRQRQLQLQKQIQLEREVQRQIEIQKQKHRKRQLQIQLQQQKQRERLQKQRQERQRRQKQRLLQIQKQKQRERQLQIQREKQRQSRLEKERQLDRQRQIQTQKALQKQRQRQRQERQRQRQRWQKQREMALQRQKQLQKQRQKQYEVRSSFSGISLKKKSQNSKSIPQQETQTHQNDKNAFPPRPSFNLVRQSSNNTDQFKPIQPYFFSRKNSKMNEVQKDTSSVYQPNKNLNQPFKKQIIKLGPYAKYQSAKPKSSKINRNEQQMPSGSISTTEGAKKFLRQLYQQPQRKVSLKTSDILRQQQSKGYIQLRQKITESGKKQLFKNSNQVISSGVFSQNQDGNSIDRVTSVPSISNQYINYYNHNANPNNLNTNINMNDSGTFSNNNNNVIYYNYNNPGVRKRVQSSIFTHQNDKITTQKTQGQLMWQKHKMKNSHDPNLFNKDAHEIPVVSTQPIIYRNNYTPHTNVNTNTNNSINTKTSISSSNSIPYHHTPYIFKTVSSNDGALKLGDHQNIGTNLSIKSQKRIEEAKKQHKTIPLGLNTDKYHRLSSLRSTQQAKPRLETYPASFTSENSAKQKPFYVPEKYHQINSVNLISSPNYSSSTQNLNTTTNSYNTYNLNSTNASLNNNISANPNMNYNSFSSNNYVPILKNTSYSHHNVNTSFTQRPYQEDKKYVQVPINSTSNRPPSYSQLGTNYTSSTLYGIKK